jgi:hypothetical protein
MDQLNARLDELTTLEEGWMDGDGEVISLQPLERAQKFIDLYRDLGDDTPKSGFHIFPTLEGGVSFQGRSKTQSWSCEFSNGDEVFVIVLSSSTEVQEYFETASVQEAFQRLQTLAVIP